MDLLLSVGLGNALAAALLAPSAAILARLCRRRPALAHALWLIVLLRLVAPPMVAVPLAWPDIGAMRAEPASIPEPTRPVAAEIGPALAGPVPLAEDWAEQGGADAPPLALLPRLDTLPRNENETIAGPSVDPPSEVVAEPAELRRETPPPVMIPPPRPPWSWPRWQVVISSAWGASALIWSLVALGRIRRFGRLLRSAEPAPGAIQDRSDELARRLGLRRGPEVVLVPGPLSPLIWALGGPPALVVPSALWGRLDDDQRDTLLVHELAHLRRRDHWFRALELAATALYWWHPALWWARRGLRRAEEQCCDAWVVWALPDAARTYATALVETIDFLSEARPALPIGASGMGRVQNVSRRITMVMRGTTPRALSWAGLLAVLGLGVLMLTWRPTRAQQAAAQDKTSAVTEAPTTTPAPPAQDITPAPDDARRRIAEELYKKGYMAESQYRRFLADAGAEAKADGSAAGAVDPSDGQAEGRLRRAENQLRRLESLLKRGALSQGEYDRAAADYEEAKAAAEAAKAAKAEAIGQARDEVEILETQLGTKESQVKKAQAQREAAMAELSRVRSLNRRGEGFVSPAEIQKAEAEVKMADALIDEKQSEKREAEIRLKQAKRRLVALERAAAPRPTAAPPAAPRESSDRRQVINRLKQIGLALHNYASSHDGRFPPPSIGGKLSWRVAILPFLEQEELYRQFHLDEPWDSPHNKALIERMPAVYRTPGPGAKAPDQTFLQAVVGPETAWGDSEGVKFSDITDGTANTLMVVEATNPATWTKPDDVALDVAGRGPDGGLAIPTTLPGLGLPDADDFLALFGDGSVRALRKAISPVTFYALTTRAGGEVVSADQPDQQPGRRQGQRPTGPRDQQQGSQRGQRPGGQQGGQARGGMTRSKADADTEQSIKNLKQIGLALHNYLDMRDHFPPPSIGGKLSWRVAILPLLGEAELYNQFDLNEPWDGPHNKALLDEMPAVFRLPGAVTREPNQTFYQAIVGPETAWIYPDGTPIAQITDGTSNTLMVVEAALPVPWTRPEDLPYPAVDPAAPYPANIPPPPRLGRPGSDRFLALFADGSVRTLKLPMRNSLMLHALITRAGGEVLSDDDAGRHAEQIIHEGVTKAATPTPPQPGGMAQMMAGGMMGGAPAPTPSGSAGMRGGMAGMMGMMRGMGQPPSDSQRITALEQKLDRLLKEIEGLRHDRKPETPEAK